LNVAALIASIRFDLFLGKPKDIHGVFLLIHLAPACEGSVTLPDIDQALRE
jgi:hypothetical protein